MEKQNQSRKCRKVGPYLLLRPIGKGSYSTVWEATSAGVTFAVKQISLQNLPDKNLQRIRQQLEVLSMMKHPNIVTLVDYKQTAHNLYLVFEHCKNTDLNAYIHQHYDGSLPEEQVRRILIQLKSAFEFIREHKVVHRDLKLHNILVTQDFEIKLADFGFAKLLEHNQYFSSWVGTPLTMAPEIFNRKQYNEKCDIWSLGVITYQMLQGQNPFFDKDKLSYREIKESYSKEVKFPKKISPLAEDLIKKMLIVDPKQRMSFPQFFQHPWLQDKPGCLSQLLRGETLRAEVARSLIKSSKPAVEKEFILQNCQAVLTYALLQFLRNYIQNSLTTWLNLAKHLMDLNYPNPRLTFLALAVILENVDQTLASQRKVVINSGQSITLPEYMQLRKMQTWEMSEYTKRLPGFVTKSRATINEYLQGHNRVYFSKQQREISLWSLFFSELKAESDKEANENLRLFLKVKNWQGPNLLISVTSTVLSSHALDILLHKVSLNLNYHQLCKKCCSIFKLAIISESSPFEAELKRLRVKILNDSQEQ